MTRPVFKVFLRGVGHGLVEIGGVGDDVLSHRRVVIEAKQDRGHFDVNHPLLQTLLLLRLLCVPLHFTAEHVSQQEEALSVLTVVGGKVSPE